MAQDNILILDADIDAAGILKEHLNSLGYFHVYLSTHREILGDLHDQKHFSFWFLDVETIAPCLSMESGPASDRRHNLCKVLMHWEYNDLARMLMQHLVADHFLRKPFAAKTLADIFIKK